MRFSLHILLNLFSKYLLLLTIQYDFNIELQNSLYCQWPVTRADTEQPQPILDTQLSRNNETMPQSNMITKARR